MAWIKPGKNQIGLFDKVENQLKSDDLENKIIINNDPAFGLLNDGIPEQMANVFRRRKEPKLDDHFNFDLIKGIFSGHHQMEYGGMFGIPIEIYGNLNTSDIPSLCFGIDYSKKRNPDLGGFPFGKLIAHLVGIGYQMEGMDKYAKNAIRAMKHMELGFTGHPNIPKIKDRMNNLENNVKIQFMRSFHTPRFVSQEIYGNVGADYHDPVFEVYNFKGKPQDINDARDMYVEKFIKKIKNKQIKGNDFNTENFKGFIVPSFTDPVNKEYYVEMVIPFSRKRIEPRYSCTCPHYFHQKAECKHIKSIKQITS